MHHAPRKTVHFPLKTGASTTFSMAQRGPDPLPGREPGAAGGLGPPPEERDPGRPPGVPPPLLSRRTALRLAGGVASELRALKVLSAPLASADPRSRSYPAGSRGCSRPTAALAVVLRRGHALLGSPRVPAPRSSDSSSAAAAAQAARATCSYCVSLRAPQARGPDCCSSVSGLLAGWSGSCHRHAETVCSRGCVLKKSHTPPRGHAPSYHVHLRPGP